MIKIYLAGKINKGDWRTSIVQTRNYPCFFLNSEDREKFEYSGPYFISDDHGCFHGDSSHGRAADRDYPTCCGSDTEKDQEIQYPERKIIVIEKCKKWIENSDILFVWLDSLDSYGTIAEIGYAHCLQKHICIAVKHGDIGETIMKEMWLCLKMTQNSIIRADDSITAWNRFKKNT